MTSAFLRTAAIAVAASLVTACGGGSSSPTSSVPSVGVPTPASTSVPVSTSTMQTAQINGAPAFVTAAGLTVYIFDADLAAPGTSVCTGSCATNWPPVGPPRE